MCEENRITRNHYKQETKKGIFFPPNWLRLLIHEAISPICNQNLDIRMSKERPKRNIIQKKYVSGYTGSFICLIFLEMFMNVKFTASGGFKEYLEMLAFRPLGMGGGENSQKASFNCKAGLKTRFV